MTHQLHRIWCHVKEINNFHLSTGQEHSLVFEFIQTGLKRKIRFNGTFFSFSSSKLKCYLVLIICKNTFSLSFQTLWWRPQTEYKSAVRWSQSQDHARMSNFVQCDPRADSPRLGTASKWVQPFDMILDLGLLISWLAISASGLFPLVISWETFL